MENYGKLEIRFSWIELMRNAQSREKRQNFIREIKAIGGGPGDWNGYTNTMVLRQFPQSKVPDVRDWLDNHGFIEADIFFMERPEQ